MRPRGKSTVTAIAITLFDCIREPNFRHVLGIPTIRYIVPTFTVAGYVDNSIRFRSGSRTGCGSRFTRWGGRWLWSGRCGNISHISESHSRIEQPERMAISRTACRKRGFFLKGGNGSGGFFAVNAVDSPDRIAQLRQTFLKSCNFITTITFCKGFVRGLRRRRWPRSWGHCYHYIDGSGRP